MRNNGARLFRLRGLLFAALVYLLLDYPIRATGAFGFPAGVGIKNFLPFTGGIFLGPAGAAGCALGAAASGALAGTPKMEILAECLCALAAGLGSWLGWFSLHRDGNVRLERARDVGIFLALAALLSAACGGITAALLGGSLFLPTAGGYLSLGILTGLLACILMGGIFCVRPPLPPFCAFTEDIPVLLSPDSPDFDAVNEAIEERARALSIPLKRVFEVENCLEELYLRLQKKLPGAEVRGGIEMGATISMRICAEGKKADPFLREEGDDESDLAALKLLRHRALRASYAYGGGENRIHIVV